MQKVKNLLHRNKDETAHNAPVSHQNAPLAHQNPLDRNHDGRVDVNDLTGRQPLATGLAPGMTQTTTTTTTEQTLLNNGLENRRLSQGYVAEPLIENRRLSRGYVEETTTLSSGSYTNVAGNRLSVTRAEPTVVETIQKDVVIQERIHPVEKEEIQPIIYREREQLDVRQVTQMMHETQIQPTLIEQRELAAEVRAPIVERGAIIEENIVLPSTTRDATLRTQQIHAPIVEEVIRKTVIEEIQPVLERDVFVPTVVQHTQPIYEKIVEAPTVYREVRDMREMGTRNVEYTQPIIREAPVVVAPVVMAPAPIVERAAPITEHVTMSTTTTTTDSFIPAKMVQEGQLRNFQPATSQVAPLGTHRV